MLILFAPGQQIEKGMQEQNKFKRVMNRIWDDIMRLFMMYVHDLN